MVVPLRPGAKVMVFCPGVLLAATMASRNETLPSAAGKLATVPWPQTRPVLKGGSTVSWFVVTTIVAAAADETRLQPDRQRLSTQAVKLLTMRFAFMMFFLPLVVNGLNAVFFASSL